MSNPSKATTKANRQPIDYAAAGVDIAAGNLAVAKIKRHVHKTFSPAVLTGLGSFGGLFDLTEINQHYQRPVLVQSIDGVGTKMMLAKLMQDYRTIGHDLVSAVVNDIIVMGAKPYILLDYIANDKLDPNIVETIVAGIADACAAHEIALIGGETAEMPGTYLPGEHDLVGAVTGVVEKDRIITGANIQPGDKLYALPSSGLHTNGYSLARKLCLAQAKLSLTTYQLSTGISLGEALLTPHINYTKPVFALLDQAVPIKGMAHITGGGVLENLPRILPEHCAAVVNKTAFPQLAIFELLSELSQLPDSELYKTFNMGVGLIFVLAADQAYTVEQLSEQCGMPVSLLGEVVPAESALDSNNSSKVVLV